MLALTTTSIAWLIFTITLLGWAVYAFLNIRAARDELNAVADARTARRLPCSARQRKASRPASALPARNARGAPASSAAGRPAR